RSFIQRTTIYVVLVINLILALVIFRLVGALRPWRGLLVSAIVVLVFVVIAFLSFSYWNLWVDLASPLIAVGVSYTGASLFYYTQERKERYRILNMFGHYVPDQVITKLVAQPELLKLGGERRELTILFADVVSFTSICEQFPPEQLVDFLNEYMTEMTEIILTHNGIIDKYQGDLIMAEFGAPVSLDRHEEWACLAALKMQARLSELRSQWIKTGKPPLYVRIGINTGEVIVGNMGSKSVFDYTALGDAVNVSSRLEKINKIYGTQILISQFTKQAVGDHFVTRVLDDLRLSGRSEPIRVYELVAAHLEDLQESKQRFLEFYQQGWTHFRTHNWQQAILCFQQALDIDPDDQPSQLFLGRCRQYEKDPPDDHWDGVYTIQVT
ncbi:MAG: adenylate/guanylate cyclase domain-containing protein, partial [bacterium]